MKRIRAVSPFLRDKGNNFKMQPYHAWLAVGGKEARPHYPPRRLHGLAYKFDYPTLFTNKDEARLRFVEVNSITFDAFPDYITHEVVPMIWDCWPQYDDKLVHWLQKHRVRACIFTSSQAAQRIQERMPDLKILVITEGIDCKRYGGGRDLNKREIDYYTYGRLPESLYNLNIEGITEMRGGAGNLLFERLQNAKITVALPQCDVYPERTGGQETLTQRYWECMLSRTVLLGRSPKELIDLIGYDPVINVDYNNLHEQIRHISSRIAECQELVNRNREIALRMAPWEIRMRYIMDCLHGWGYSI